ncbi:hypothetical protein PsorP6_017416 [Peronosclerospora sorghi]|uniref:Uncharacterized protein n=1 Tax=Peronosclerospora sorghi TaxID=230839 RepID=A0ACC0WLP8_9STRA|nr:hypothetical protein PsorP6_017416 [Peronosclerospora sorghi]
MAKPKLVKQRSLSSPTGGRVTHMTTNSSTSLPTLNEYVPRAQHFARERVYETLQKYHSNRAAASYASGDTSGVDCSQWKLAKGGGRHHAISCYKRVSSFKSSFKGLKIPHRKKKHPTNTNEDTVRMTMSNKSTPSIPISDQAELLAIGVMAGTLEDVLHGTVNLTPEAMQIESAHSRCDLLDCRVLAALVSPTVTAPFRSITLKWALRHHDVLSRHRDYVYLEATGLLRDSQDNNARVGYHLVHSVTLPSVPELAHQMQVVRGHLSYCYLYRQRSKHEVEMFFHGGMLPRGGAKDRLAFALAADTVMASPSTIECAMMKKLAFTLRTKQPPTAPLSPKSHPNEVLSQSGRKSAFDASAFRASSATTESTRTSSLGGGLHTSSCHICHRHMRAFFGGKGICCKMCDQSVCNRCKVIKKVFVFENGVFHPQKMNFCSDCIVATNRLNAGWVASQELTGAANPVRLSGWSSPSPEGNHSKTHVHLNLSTGMPRVEDNRATLYVDGPLGRTVVWLPTDQFYLRPNAMDPMDLDVANDPTRNKDVKEKNYHRLQDDSFIDTEAFVTLEDPFDGDEGIPMIDIPSDGEEDVFLESERSPSRCSVELMNVGYGV